MKLDIHLAGLQRMYQLAAINQQLFTGTQMKLSEGECTLEMSIKPDYFHGMQAVHGAVYFKILDDAAFFAVQSRIQEHFILTTSFNIHFLRPVTGGTLTAKGTARHVSRNLFIADASLINDKGREVGFGVGNFARSPSLLRDADGYLSPH